MRPLALPLALAGLVLLGVVEMIERREAKRLNRVWSANEEEMRKLGRAFERLMAEIDDAERETLEMVPYSMPVSDGVRLNAPGGDA